MEEKQQAEIKPYIINSTEFKLKERYSLKDWGKILKLIGEVPLDGQVMGAIGVLLAGDNVNHILSIILDKPVVGEIFEEDLLEVSRAINDFFSRKKSLMPNINHSSSN